MARNAEQLRYHREYMKRYSAEHPEYAERQNKLRYLRDCKDRKPTNKRIRDWRSRQRLLVITLLGKRCACCGEESIEFLTIDHKNGGGNKHRSLYVGRREAFWKAVSQDPKLKEKYQVLCIGCNWARGIHGHCPHERESFDPIGLAC